MDIQTNSHVSTVYGDAVVLKQVTALHNVGPHRCNFTEFFVRFYDGKEKWINSEDVVEVI